MAEKSVLRRPQDIDAVINRGGSSAASQEENKEKERIFNLRCLSHWLTRLIPSENGEQARFRAIPGFLRRLRTRLSVSRYS
jgi:hypothetical protein